MALKQPWIGGPAIENSQKHSSLALVGGVGRPVWQWAAAVGGRENTSVVRSQVRNKRQTDRQREQEEITEKAWGNKLPVPTTESLAECCKGPVRNRDMGCQ